MFIKKAGDGNYYVYRVSGGGGKPRGVGNRGKAAVRNWFLIKFKGNSNGQLNVGNINIPNELVGKKIMLKVEVVKDGLEKTMVQD